MARIKREKVDYDYRKDPASNTETEMKVNAIAKDLCNGVRYDDIRIKLRHGDYGGKKVRTFANEDQLIKKAKEKLKAEWKEELDGAREILVERFLDLYNDCRRNNDRSNANNALKELGKLMGAYDAEKLDVNLNGTIDIDFGID